MFAVIRTGGKQYKVKKDDKILIEKIDGNQGDSFKIDEILYVNDGKKSTVGAPVVAGASVEATVIRQTRAAKVIIFKKKRRQNYRRKRGHKQHLTLIQITDIKAA